MQYYSLFFVFSGLMSRFQPQQHRLAMFWNEKCVPADIYSSENYHRSSCEHFARCFINPTCLSVVQDRKCNSHFYHLFSGLPTTQGALQHLSCSHAHVGELVKRLLYKQTNRKSNPNQSGPLSKLVFSVLPKSTYSITTDPLISGAPSLSPEPRRHRCSDESLQVCCWDESDG